LPDGSLYEKSLYQENSRWTTFGGAILQSGTYTFRFVPQNDTSVTLDFGFTNNNRSELKTLNADDNISTSLTGWGHEYDKYKIELDAGDLVEVTAPSDGDVWLYLLNTNGLNIYFGTGEIFTRVSQAGTYYLFIVNKDHASGSSYSGSITVTPDPDRDKYPEFSIIQNQQATLGENFTLDLSALSPKLARSSNISKTYSATGLPPNLTLNRTTGLISGTLQAGGTYPVRAWVKNEFGLDQEDFLISTEPTGDKSAYLYLPLIIKHN
jgi:hypothetical protein